MSEGDYMVALPEGTDVGGYRLLRVLGDGGFGITYMAENFRQDRFAIKEYLPNQFAVRVGTEVHPKSEQSREDFEWGRERFVEEARMLARFKHPNIVQVEHFFTENNTAYIVMEYEDGEPLDELLRRRGALTEAQLTRILLPIADGLREVHARGVWHRDIKPGNIFVRRSDESPVLLDFGAARNALGVKSESIEAIVSPPYSPPEQYYSEGELGAYTDIYALCALCYRAIAGEAPAESLLRQRKAYEKKRDPLSRLVDAPPRGYSRALLAAVDWGLRLEEAERPQSVEGWLAAIEGGEPSVEADREEEDGHIGSTGPESTEPKAEETQRVSVFRKLVRGQYGLANTYWRFGIYGGLAFGTSYGAASTWDGSGMAAYAVLLVYLAYLSSVAVGVWRAGYAYQGPPFWYISARMAACAGIGGLMLLLGPRTLDVLDDLGMQDWVAANYGSPEPPPPARSPPDEESHENGVKVDPRPPQPVATLPTPPKTPREVGERFRDENSAKADPRPSQPATTPPAPPKAAREVGERFRECAMCPEVVVLPAGSYRMGSPAGLPGREPREGPAHEVTFAAPFAIGVYEVKVSEFERFVEEAGYSAGNSCKTLEEGEYQERVGRSWRNPGFPQDGGHPVACVNWADAQAYAAWLSRKTGEGYRLPSEAEWEYAARAGTTTVRYWNEAEADQCRFANGADASISDYWDDDTTAPCHDGYVKTSPVGSFAANSWGLADLLGNVLEWTADCWNSNYVGAPASGNAWQTGDCTRRILRGGSWISEPSRLRFADRRWPSDGAASRYDYFGFRVARTIESKQLTLKQPLTVRTGPPDSRVRIMNITPRYQPGIKLPPGSYDVTVTANGFDKVERTLRHGDEPTNVWIGLPFRDCPVCPKMVEIPTGRYTMGTTRGPDRYRDEGPAHEVNIGSPIAVGMFEVSFAEWDACLADGGCKRHLKNEGTGRGPHPVSHANVEDAREYVKWLTFRTDRQYRLLSEAEWEYAARAGTESERHWQVAADQCLYENGLDLAIQTVAERVGLSGWADCTDGYVYAAPGEGTRLKPNPWGLYHMLGNVSEWTADCWHPNYQGAPTDGSAWRDRSGECDNGQVVMRGGSWSSIPKNVRAPFRGGVGHDPTIGRVDVGFRVAAQITR